MRVKTGRTESFKQHFVVNFFDLDRGGIDRVKIEPSVHTDLAAVQFLERTQDITG